MTIELSRQITGDLAAAESREWLVTNGIGGYASGTVAGLLSRRYHGILVAALSPPLGRTLLLAKLDETIAYGGKEYPLFSNRWSGGLVEPTGYRCIESFQLQGAIPVWRFAFGDALLEKRIWMRPGANTTYITYYLEKAAAPVAFSIKALLTYRDFHALNLGEDWPMTVDPVDHGLRVTAYETAAPYFILSDRAELSPAHEWYTGFDLAIESYRGQDHREDLLQAGAFRATLEPGEGLTIIATTEQGPDLDGPAALEKRRRYEGNLLRQGNVDGERRPDWVRQLILAADQFIVSRPSAGQPEGKSIIAGYHWFGDWGRDTMISLPGLTLTTGRAEIARAILLTFAKYVDRGMLPNRFPDYGQRPEYNTADATLWYFEAISAYHQATGDDQLIGELFPVLAEIITRHQQGTRFQIRVDPRDGLLYAGQPGVQLTWMDAKVDEWVVTPRIGKPIEINALWYNALHTMANFARLLKKPYQAYEIAAGKALQGFGRFWNEQAGYCYDVLDGLDGNDLSLRPNQIFAVSLPQSPLPLRQQRAVVEACRKHLLTPNGLRSLAPADPNYHGHYGGDIRQRDGSYHQGTVWGWLLGPFCLAHHRVYGDPDQALAYLQPMADHLATAGVGTLSEIFDGDPPMTPRGCIAQAWTVAEVLRAWELILKK